MGLQEVPKLCKVTVHRVSPQPAAAAPPTRHRSTSAVQVHRWALAKPSPPTEAPAAHRTRRARTVTEGMGYEREVKRELASAAGMLHTPMWRLTQRMTPPDPDATTVDPSVASVEAANPLSESFFRVDTNERDPEPVATKPDESLFEPATPPIPCGWTLDMLPTSTSPDAVANDWCDVEKSLDVVVNPENDYDTTTTSNSGSYDSDYPALPDLGTSHIRISTPHSDDQAFSFSQPMDSFSTEPEVETPTLPASLHAETVEIEAMRANFISFKRLDEPEQPLLVESTDDEDDDASPMLEGDADDNVGAPNPSMDECFDVCDDFDAILGDPAVSRPSRWHLSMNFARRSFRTASERIGRIPSPPPQARNRNRSAPAPCVRPAPVEAVGEPLFHGQILHLAFQASTGDLMQVSCHERRSHKNPLAKRILCRNATDLPMAHCDALRIIGHGAGGLIRGGDAISLARNDGSVLRMQTLSSKLCFSRKIDLKAKFVVCGIPEGMAVTTTTKFYLQSVHDRTKTVGFLSDARHLGLGTLGVYAYGEREERSEPVQFFRRPAERPLSPLVAGL